MIGSSLRAKLRSVHRRRGHPHMIDGRLSVAWAYTRSEGADIYATGGDGTRSADRHLVLGAFVNEQVRMVIRDGKIEHVREKSLAEELIDRGYDITTIRFSVDKLPTPPVEQIETPPSDPDSEHGGSEREKV